MHEAYIGAILLCFNRLKRLKLGLFHLTITAWMNMWEKKFVYSCLLKILGATLRWVVSFTPRSLYPKRNSIRWPRNKRLDASETTKPACPCRNWSTDASVVQTYDVSHNWFERTKSNNKIFLLLHSTAPSLYKDLKLRKIKASLAANQCANFLQRVFTTK
jgi:hypothetical protein